MAPKRKQSEVSDDEVEETQLEGESQLASRPSALKKSKSSVLGGEATSNTLVAASSSSSVIVDYSAKHPRYTNKALPTTIALPAPTPGTTKLCAWNVCGLRASQKKGFRSYVHAEKPDVLVLTEIKINEVPVDPVLDQMYPHRYWSFATKKGYAGTAIFSKVKPISVSYTFCQASKADGDQDDANAEGEEARGGDNAVVDTKGRLVVLEFASTWLVGTYVPNAGQKLKTIDVKQRWQTAFEAHLLSLDSTKKAVIWTGDLNVAPTAKDLKNPKPNWNKTAGYTAIETEWYNKLCKNGFVDVWRKRNPEVEAYSYYSTMRQCREKGIGWRLDMFVLSERLLDRVKTCDIREEIYGASDHIPIVLEIEGEL